MKRGFVAAAAATAAAALILAGCSNGGSGGGDKTDTGSSSASSTDDSGLGGGGGEGGKLTFADVELLKQYNTDATDASLYDSQAVGLLQGGFAYYNSKLELVKDESFGKYEKVSDDPLVVKYTISDDAKWSDGEPVSAVDMYLRWAALSGKFNTVNPADEDENGNPLDENGNPIDLANQVFFNATSPGITYIDKVEIGDDLKTVTMTYDRPYADWELNMTGVGVPSHVVGMHALGITDAKEAVTAVQDAITNKDNAKLAEISKFWNTGFQVGTQLSSDKSLYLSSGRFLLENWTLDQFQTFTKNPDYKGDKPASIDQLTVRKLDKPPAMLQALQNGEIDAFATNQVDKDLVDGAKALPSDTYTTVQGDAGSYGHIDLAFKGGGAFDPATYGGDAAKALKVRQAFLKVLPRQGIVDKLVKPLNPDAKIRDSFTQVPGSPWYDDVIKFSGMEQYDTQDVEGAKALLAEAGVTTPINVRFLFSSESSERAQQFQIMSQALTDSGLFTAQDLSSKDWSKKLSEPSGYDATFFGWISTSTAVTEFDANFRTDAVNNRQGYSNTEVDALLDQIAVETDPAKQKEIVEQVEKHLVDDAFGAPFSQAVQLTVYNNKVEGIDAMSISPTIYWNPWDWKVKG